MLYQSGKFCSRILARQNPAGVAPCSQKSQPLCSFCSIFPLKRPKLFGRLRLLPSSFSLNKHCTLHFVLLCGCRISTTECKTTCGVLASTTKCGKCTSLSQASFGKIAKLKSPNFLHGFQFAQPCLRCANCTFAISETNTQMSVAASKRTLPLQPLTCNEICFIICS